VQIALTGEIILGANARADELKALVAAWIAHFTLRSLLEPVSRTVCSGLLCPHVWRVPRTAAIRAGSVRQPRDHHAFHGC
jgi:hypothetical protein